MKSSALRVVFEGRLARRAHFVSVRYTLVYAPQSLNLSLVCSKELLRPGNSSSLLDRKKNGGAREAREAPSEGLGAVGEGTGEGTCCACRATTRMRGLSRLATRKEFLFRLPGSLSISSSSFGPSIASPFSGPRHLRQRRRGSHPSNLRSPEPRNSTSFDNRRRSRCPHQLAHDHPLVRDRRSGSACRVRRPRLCETFP